MAKKSIMNRLRVWLRGEKQVSALQPLWESTIPQYAMVGDFNVMVKEGYRKNELIYACITAKAKTAQQIALQVADTKDEEFDEHPLLDLIHHPNDYMNESDFWASVSIFQALAGRAVYEIEYNNRGMPMALWPLRPDWIKLKPKQNSPVIDYYEYTVPGYAPVIMKPEQVLDFPLFDPLNRFVTYPPVAIAGRVGDVDNAATDLIKLIFESGGVPFGYLKTTQVITDEAQAEATRNRWLSVYGGWKNWIKPMLLDRDADYVKLSMNLDDEMGFANLDARNEARICAVLDVPPIIVGAKVGLEHGTYSNYKEARRVWWEDTVLAMYNNYMDVIEYKLLPLFPDAAMLKIGWDTSRVYAFGENENEAWKRATDAWNANAITLAQFCDEIGLEEPKEGGEKYKNEMTTPPQLQAFAQPEKQPSSQEQREGEQGSAEMERDREEADMKGITALLAEIKAIRAEIKTEHAR